MGPEVDVAIVGGGPVGLLLACLLRARGRSVLVLEKRVGGPRVSAAIGITPPSLRILSRLGLADGFVAAGVRIRDCHIHGRRGRLGCVSFREIPDERPFVLSLPQAETVARLRAHLGAAHLREGCEVTGLRQGARGVVLETSSGPVAARFAVGCDGARSRVRALAGLAAPRTDYPCHFAMGDFADRSGLGDEAHLFFTPDGSVETFPLPGGMRRWVVQTDTRLDPPPPGLVGRLARARAGIGPDDADPRDASAFTPRRHHAARYHAGRVALCGDAAHGMTPAGGQGMNVGFADAEMLAAILAGPDALSKLPRYSRVRRRAARRAIAWAGWGMRLGTWRGAARSIVRDALLGFLLKPGPRARWMGRFYAGVGARGRAAQSSASQQEAGSRKEGCAAGRSKQEAGRGKGRAEN